MGHGNRNTHGPRGHGGEVLESPCGILVRCRNGNRVVHGTGAVGTFGLLGAGDDPIDQPLTILCNVSRNLKPRAKALFTVLNAAAMLRKYQNKDVAEARFDPLTLVTLSAHAPQEGLGAVLLRERAFVPTELSLLFRLAGMPVLNMWGGTAGNWGRRTIDLDEIEIMIVARKTAKPLFCPS